MIRPKIIVISALLSSALGAHTGYASSNPINQYIPAADAVGQAKLKVFVWEIYDATLLASEGEFSPQSPFALQLDYARKLVGKKIVEQTMSEIKSQGVTDISALENWQQQLLTIIPDVDKDDTIIGIKDQDENTHFYLNNTKIGQIADPLFSFHFFNIWLGNQTSQPELRDQLLGLR